MFRVQGLRASEGLGFRAQGCFGIHKLHGEDGGLSAFGVVHV